jgi:hypothetical protein
MKTIATFIFTVIIASNCLSQNISPKNKATTNSLYPNARIIGGSQNSVILYCNCPENDGEIQLTFDTNANVLVKEYFYNSLSSLPDAILSYINKTTSETVIFDNTDMRKGVYNTGEIYYKIFMKDNDIPYEIKIKNTGEVISKTCIIGRS